jgi:hypothetical protein
MSSTQKLQQLAHLQVQICTSAERIKYLKHKIHLLSNNKCYTVISFKITNKDQAAINEGQKQVDHLEAEPTIFGPRVIESKVPEAQFHFSDTIEESTAMRMINIMYQEEIEYHNNLVAQMEKLVLENYNTAIDPSMAQA